MSVSVGSPLYQQLTPFGPCKVFILTSLVSLVCVSGIRTKSLYSKEIKKGDVHQRAAAHVKKWKLITFTEKVIVFKFLRFSVRCVR